nr:Hint domain-containing protein [Falsirhodobacter halotolerans]
MPACVSRGTMVDTYHGPMPVEDIVVGDLLMTKDDGFQPVRWLGAIMAEGRGRLAPVRISSGVIGNGRSLIVSQQQPILVSDWRAELLFGTREVLIPARLLVNEETIWIREGGMIDYHLILFDRHQIFYADDSFAASFNPAAPGRDMIGAEACEAVCRALPALKDGWDAYGPPCRPVMKPYEMRALKAYGV